MHGANQWSGPITHSQQFQVAQGDFKTQGLVI